MCSFGADEYISRVVAQYSAPCCGWLCPGCPLPPTRKTPFRRDFSACSPSNLPFAEDFQRRTVQRLRQATGQRSEKEFIFMKKKRFALVAAALATLLVVSAAAAVMLLGPKEVAQYVGDQVLAQAFEGEGAVAINETKSVCGYDVTLVGGRPLAGQRLDLGRQRVQLR